MGKFAKRVLPIVASIELKFLNTSVYDRKTAYNKCKKNETQKRQNIQLQKFSSDYQRRSHCHDMRCELQNDTHKCEDPQGIGFRPSVFLFFFY